MIEGDKSNDCEWQVFFCGPNEEVQATGNQRVSIRKLAGEESRRWGVGLTASKMADSRWLKPVLVWQFEFVEWTTGRPPATQPVHGIAGG